MEKWKVERTRGKSRVTAGEKRKRTRIQHAPGPKRPGEFYMFIMFFERRAVEHRSKICRNYDLKMPEDAEFRAESEFDDAVALQKHFAFQEYVLCLRSDEIMI